MSAILKRPNGDDVAIHYGKYYTSEEIESKVKPGMKLDILCKDGLNYLVEVKQFDVSSGIGHLHFCRWSNRTDYKGSLLSLYLTKYGRYSFPSGLSEKNDYVKINKNNNNNNNNNKEKLNNNKRKFIDEIFGEELSDNNNIDNINNNTIFQHRLLNGLLLNNNDESSSNNNNLLLSNDSFNYSGLISTNYEHWEKYKKLSENNEYFINNKIPEPLNIIENSDNDKVILFFLENRINSIKRTIKLGEQQEIRCMIEKLINSNKKQKKKLDNYIKEANLYYTNAIAINSTNKNALEHTLSKLEYLYSQTIENNENRYIHDQQQNNNSNNNDNNNNIDNENNTELCNICT